MMLQKLEINTEIQIQKPVSEVFEAIVNPSKMSKYFISKSTGHMEEGKKIIWNFPEFDVDVPIKVCKMEKDRYISYSWDIDDQELLVEITLTSKENNSTLVSITEKSRDCDDLGIIWLKRNTAGWTNFLACLKAFLEYGINLRKGAFDFL